MIYYNTFSEAFLALISILADEETMYIHLFKNENGDWIIEREYFPFDMNIYLENKSHLCDLFYKLLIYKTIGEFKEIKICYNPHIDDYWYDMTF